MISQPFQVLSRTERLPRSLQHSGSLVILLPEALGGDPQGLASLLRSVARVGFATSFPEGHWVFAFFCFGGHMSFFVSVVVLCLLSVCPVLQWELAFDIVLDFIMMKDFSLLFFQCVTCFRQLALESGLRRIGA